MTDRNDASMQTGDSTRRRWWLALGVVLLLGAGLRLAYLRERAQAPDAAAPALDAGFHDYWARSLALGDTSRQYEYDDPHLDTVPYLRPPGYPFFLAAIYAVAGHNLTVARAVQAAIGLASCVLIFLLGRRLFSPAAGLIAAALLAVQWAVIYFEGELLAPVLLVPLGIAGVYVLALWTDRFTYPRCVVGGALIGLFALVRPNILLCAPVVLLWAWWVARRRKDGRRLRKALIGFPLGLAAVVAPVTLRNLVVADDLVLISCNGGINLYVGNNPLSDGVTPIIPGLQEMTGDKSWQWFNFDRVVRGVEHEVGRPMTYSEVSTYFARKAGQYAATHPWETVQRVARKAALFWGPAEISNNKEVSLERSHSPLLRGLPGFPLALSLGLLGLGWYACDRRRSSEPHPGAARGDATLESLVLIVAIVAVYFASFLPFLVAARFRVPIVPFLALMGGYGVERLVRTLVQRRWMPAIGALAAWAVALLVASTPIVPYHPDADRWHFDRALAFHAQEDLDRAITEYRAALEVNDRNAATHYDLGLALEQKGNVDAAMTEYRSALTLDPAFSRAALTLAALLYKQDQRSDAIDVLAAAWRANPSDEKVAEKLGLAWLEAGKAPAAVECLSALVGRRPEVARYQATLGRAFVAAGQPTKAIAPLQAALKADPSLESASLLLANSLAMTGQYPYAVAEYRKLLAAHPDLVEAANDLAWILATRPDIEEGDAQEAVRLAEGVCASAAQRTANHLDSLAAAYAAAGQFEKAVDTAREALARATGDPDLRAKLEKRLRLYEANHRFVVGET